MGEPDISSRALEEALLKVLSPLLSNPLGTTCGARVRFYDKFQRETDEYDRDLLNKYGEDLSTTLIFAGLFSAVTTTFIVDVQSNFQPDFQKITCDLLKILIDSSRGNLQTDVNVALPRWNGPDPAIVHVQAILYSSLATSLLATFIAVLGKQWLNRYTRVDMRGSVIDRSRHRQRKMNGMETWHFDLVMESLPLMLQLALLLLGYALSNYLFYINKVVASVVIGFTAFGLLFYFLIAFAATFSRNCPFQTPLSLIIRALIRFDNKHKRCLKRTKKWFNRGFSNRKWKWPKPRCGSFRTPRADDGNNTAGHIKLAMAGSSYQPSLLFNKDTDWEGCVLDSDCIARMFEMSMDTDVVTVILGFIPEVVWHAGIRTTPLGRVYDTLVECLDRSSGDSIVIPKLKDKAYLAAKAFLHLAIQRKSIGDECDANAFKTISNRHLPVGPRTYEGDPDLISTLGIIDCVLGGSALMDWQHFSFTTTHRAWMGHILLYRAWDVIEQRRQPLPEDIKQFILNSSCSEHPPPPPVIADCLFIIGLILEIPLHVDDLSTIDKSSKVGARIGTIYKRLGEAFKNPTPSNGADPAATINRALEALRLVSRLPDDEVASKSSDLFHVIMDASVPKAYTEQKWEAARLTICGAYRGGKSKPRVENQNKYILHILLFLKHHFGLATGPGQDKDEPLQIALHALICISNSTFITVPRPFDPTESSFVCGIRYAFQDDRPLNLRQTALLFLPFIRDEWFKTGSLAMDPEQMKGFCADWASTVKYVEQTPAVKTAALTVFFEMINSPQWRPYVIPDTWALLEHPMSFPYGFHPPRSCINNPDLMDAIRDVDNPMAVMHWVEFLWLKYGELDPGVLAQLKAITTEIARNERGGEHFDVSRSRVGMWRESTASESRKAKDELKQYPMGSSDMVATALEEKVKGLQLAIGALDGIIRQSETLMGAKT